MYKLTSVFIASLCILFEQPANAQGCSDAGFCTLHSFKPVTIDSVSAERTNHITGGISYGGADNNIAAYSAYMEFGRRLHDNLRFDVKLSLHSQSNGSTQRTGLSDIFISTTYSFKESNDVTLGFKMPLSDGNSKLNGLSLPMDFQSSLGTYDLIVGFGFHIDELKFAVALQQPLLNNKNQFLTDNYPINSEFRQFQSTNKYIRKGDMLLRVSYSFSLNSDLVLTPSILPIYHLSDDSYTAINGSEQTIGGSKGTTINLNLYFKYLLNTSDRVEASIGFPLKTRTVRPDGLTRGFVVSIAYQTTF